MENSNYIQFLASPLLEKFYELPFKEQMKEILHIRKFSEDLYTLVTGETALIKGMNKHEYSVGLQFETNQLVVVLQDAFFEKEYLHYQDISDLFFVTLEERIFDAATKKGVAMKNVSSEAFKELLKKQERKYMKVLVDLSL
jgi:hypothetical protein